MPYLHPGYEISLSVRDFFYKDTTKLSQQTQERIQKNLFISNESVYEILQLRAKKEFSLKEFFINCETFITETPINFNDIKPLLDVTNDEQGRRSSAYIDTYIMLNYYGQEKLAQRRIAKFELIFNEYFFDESGNNLPDRNKEFEKILHQIGRSNARQQRGGWALLDNFMDSLIYFLGSWEWTDIHRTKSIELHPYLSNYCHAFGHIGMHKTKNSTPEQHSSFAISRRKIAQSIIYNEEIESNLQNYVKSTYSNRYTYKGKKEIIGPESFQKSHIYSYPGSFDDDLTVSYTNTTEKITTHNILTALAIKERQFAIIREKVEDLANISVLSLTKSNEFEITSDMKFIVVINPHYDAGRISYEDPDEQEKFIWHASITLGFGPSTQKHYTIIPTINNHDLLPLEDLCIGGACIKVSDENTSVVLHGDSKTYGPIQGLDDTQTQLLKETILKGTKDAFIKKDAKYNDYTFSREQEVANETLSMKDAYITLMKKDFQDENRKNQLITQLINNKETIAEGKANGAFLLSLLRGQRLYFYPKTNAIQETPVDLNLTIDQKLGLLQNIADDKYNGFSLLNAALLYAQSDNDLGNNEIIEKLENSVGKSIESSLNYYEGEIEGKNQLGSFYDSSDIISIAVEGWGMLSQLQKERVAKILHYIKSCNNARFNGVYKSNEGKDRNQQQRYHRSEELQDMIEEVSEQ